MTTPMTESLPRRWVREPRPIEFPVEELVPESKEHLELRTALYQILKLGFADRALIGSDQFVYWDPTDPSACLAPDVFVRLGGQDEIFDSWKVWERGAPHLAVEITSRSDSRDDHVEEKLEKYRRLGVRELVRFDPAEEDCPLRIWDNVDGDLVERVVSGEGTLQCPTLGLHWVVRTEGELRTLRLSRDPAGSEMLPTPAEAERRARLESIAARGEAARSFEEAARSREEAANARESQEALERRVRELEAELSRRG